MVELAGIGIVECVLILGLGQSRPPIVMFCSINYWPNPDVKIHA
jgi:hypothetical protein